MGTKAIFQPTCSETAAGCRERRGYMLPGLLASSKFCRSGAGRCSEAAAPLPKPPAVFLPRVMKRVTARQEQVVPQPCSERTWPSRAVAGPSWSLISRWFAPSLVLHGVRCRCKEGSSLGLAPLLESKREPGFTTAGRLTAPNSRSRFCYQDLFRKLCLSLL